ncbi:MAG: hypothetical protein ACOQNV_00875 [Mycoplasmoidaceae bacterium]
MKKLLLIPIILTTGLVPAISMVSCKNGDEPTEKEYDLTIIDTDPHITVTPTKFKLNQELVIHYSCVDGYVINADASAITIGDNVYQVKDLSYTKTSVTLSADKVNYETITVNFLAKETGVLMDQYGLHPGTNAPYIHSNELEIQANTNYNFTIDMTKWKGSKNPDEFQFLRFCLKGQEEEGYATITEQCRFVIDGQKEVIPQFSQSAFLTFRNKDDMTAIFNATTITGYIVTSQEQTHLESDIFDFELYASTPF